MVNLLLTGFNISITSDSFIRKLNGKPKVSVMESKCNGNRKLNGKPKVKVMKNTFKWKLRRKCVVIKC